jgi:hypothetical protein
MPPIQYCIAIVQECGRCICNMVVFVLATRNTERIGGNDLVLTKKGVLNTWLSCWWLTSVRCSMHSRTGTMKYPQRYVKHSWYLNVGHWSIVQHSTWLPLHKYHPVYTVCGNRAMVVSLSSSQNSFPSKNYQRIYHAQAKRPVAINLFRIVFYAEQSTPTHPSMHAHP